MGVMVCKENKMKRCLKPLLCVYFLLSGCSAKNEHEVSAKNITVNNNCQLIKDYVCVIPFAAIYSIATYNPKHLYGVRGYLVFEDDKYALYPSAEAMKFGVKESAILIDCDCDMSLQSVTQEIGEFVNIVGYFSQQTSHQNYEEYWAVIRIDSKPIPVGILHRGETPVAPPRPLNNK
jgi:hypothetical protein